MELISAMLLLGIIMTTVAFSSSAVVLGVKNRIDATSNYVLAMNKAQSIVYSQEQHFANSATFNVTYTGTKGTINYWEAIPTASGGYSINSTPSTIDFSAEMQKAGVSNVTVTVNTSTTDPNIVIVNLSSVDDKTGRRYENTAILRKLINAAPLLPANLASQCNFATSSSCTISLLFPVVSFAVGGATLTGSYAYVNGSYNSVTYTLAQVVNIAGQQAYKSLQVQTSTTATQMYVRIPPMIGLDSTVSAEVWIGGN